MISDLVGSWIDRWKMRRRWLRNRSNARRSARRKRIGRILKASDKAAIIYVVGFLAYAAGSIVIFAWPS